MSGLQLPTIERLVAELDGSYMGTTLYGIVREMDWGRHGHRMDSAEGDRITFYSPTHNNLRGTFSILYYSSYPKKCLPTRSELEVEIYSQGSVSLLIKSWHERRHDGVVVRMYHRDEQSSYPIYGPTRLSGRCAEDLKQYQRRPQGVSPLLMNEDCDMILLTHLALATAVRWSSNSIVPMPRTDHLLEPLEKMIRATHEYDQKVSIPPNAA